MTRELHSCEGVVQGLKEEKVSLQMEREELKAQLAFVQTRVQRLEGSGMGTLEAEGCGVPTPASLPRSAPRVQETN